MSVVNNKRVLRVLGVVFGTMIFSAPVLAQTVGDNHERLPYQLDSIISFGLLAFAVIVALTLNHQRPTVRVFGVALAALGSLAMAAIIWWLDAAGQFAEMRPPRFSIDPHKPIVMHVLAAVFLVAGLILALVASRQMRRTDRLVLARRNEMHRYGLVSRLYHWTIAILFLLLVPMGVFTTMLPYDVEYRQAFYVVHKSIGLTVFLLAGARVIWLILSPAPPLSPNMRTWERLAAKVAHFGMYFFLFAFPISGFVLGTSLGKLSHFYFWDLPLFWGPDEASLAAARWMHKIILPFAFYLVFLGHIFGAAKHQYIDNDKNSFQRMVT